MDIINSHINNGIFWKTLMDHDAWWSGPESSAAAGLPRKVVLCHHLEPRGHLSVWVDGCWWKNFHWLGTREATYTYDGYDSDGYDVCCNMFHMTNMFVLFASYDFATAVAVGLSSLSFLTGADPHQVCNHQQRLKEPVDWVDADSPTHWTDFEGLTWGNFSKIPSLSGCNFAPMIVPKVLLSSSLIWVDFVTCCTWCLVQEHQIWQTKWQLQQPRKEGEISGQVNKPHSRVRSDLIGSVPKKETPTLSLVSSISQRSILCNDSSLNQLLEVCSDCTLKKAPWLIHQ